MEARSPHNPNVCIACATAEWAEIGRGFDLSASPEIIAIDTSAVVIHELHHLLPLDGPTIVECFDAAEQARQAITETDTLESGQGRPEESHHELLEPGIRPAKSN